MPSLHPSRSQGRQGRATTAFILISIILLLAILPTAAAQEKLLYRTPNNTLLVYACNAEDACEACSPVEKSLDVCKPTGNKEPIACKPIDAVNLNDTKEHDKNIWWSPEDVIPLDPGKDPILPTWRECDLVAGIESFRFFMFEVVNIMILLVAGIVVLWRRRLMSTEQYRRIATRLAA
ncbi:uncharacterized protein SPPG_06704 [Spizellomyces punctatus DAOM BR117]|uniref:Uncharacterized protein n=1 Tax=Spizellomyces punctatus (strain DAOM BR117) TaxID=645134 RepID=A0A0L0HBJ1_SPIPD|nr:uncharacterized protein SPPG_06704 [Spizellomyces punctatus DAOM BR117]KNC98311.1 hypothetical protein SPPG_06704 [Spizellomyces punctatus DAOM BR117]|eukprot:XP_016606351.1 hypothetical protein SPPG_06704 [Spizellomyces punctatus DAOM BR117]